MNPRSDKDLERLVAERFEAIDVPDRERQEELWRRIRSGVRAEEAASARRMRRKRYAPAACALLAAGAFGAIALEPEDASALRWFRQLLVTVQEDGATAQLSETIAAEERPFEPPQVTILGAIEPVRLPPEPEALRESIAFDVPLPAYVPEGYTLDHATALQPEGGGKANEVVLAYAERGEVGALTVEIRLTPEQSSATIGFDPEDTKLSEMKLRGAGVSARALEFKDGSAMLLWTIDNMRYMISAKRLGKDELARIAESM